MTTREKVVIELVKMNRDMTPMGDIAASIDALYAEDRRAVRTADRTMRQEGEAATMNTIEALELCPFCGVEDGDHDGGAPFLRTSAMGSGGMEHVHCFHCGADGPKRETEAEAVAAWNGRALLGTAREVTPLRKGLEVLADKARERFFRADRKVDIDDIDALLSTADSEQRENVRVVAPVGCDKCDGPGGVNTFSHQVPVIINGRVECIDWCIHSIVAALNSGGIKTVASCCGHGIHLGRIDLIDGRTLFITIPNENASNKGGS